MIRRRPGQGARAWATAMLLGAWGATAAAQSAGQAPAADVSPGECARIEHDATRLACYDRWAARLPATGTGQAAPGERVPVTAPSAR